MKTLPFLGLVALTLASLTTFAQQPAADVGAGQRRAAVCFACHNPDGISKIPGTPHLSGQERGYLEQAMRAYRDGTTRQNPTMNAMAKPLSDQDIVNIAAYFSLLTRRQGDARLAQQMETCERIRPVGEVMTEAAPTAVAAVTDAAPGHAATTRSGEAVYQTACVACHGTGVAGAPKLSDAAAWAPRLAQGKETLWQHVWQGFNAMPPKGACGDCSEAELRAAVGYLTSKTP